MNTETPFHNFIDFVQCDAALVACVQTQENAARDSETLKKELSLHVNAFDQQQAALRALRKDIDACELENTALQQQKKRIETKLEAVSNPKEFSSLQSEHAQVTRALVALEEKTIDLWDKLEQSQEAFKAVEQHHAKLMADFKVREAAVEEKKALFASECERLHEVKNRLARVVRPDWLAKYESLKQYIKNPVVPVKADSCSGCFTRIPAQVITRVQHHELVPCPACQRILYEV